jgi:hypothetical protein
MPGLKESHSIWKMFRLWKRNNSYKLYSPKLDDFNNPPNSDHFTNRYTLRSWKTNHCIFLSKTFNDTNENSHKRCPHKKAIKPWVLSSTVVILWPQTSWPRHSWCNLVWPNFWTIFLRRLRSPEKVYYLERDVDRRGSYDTSRHSEILGSAASRSSGKSALVRSSHPGGSWVCPSQASVTFQLSDIMAPNPSSLLAVPRLPFKHCTSDLWQVHVAKIRCSLRNHR